MRIKIGLCLAGLMALATVGYTSVVYQATLASESALAHDKTFTVDLRAHDVLSASAQVSYTSATVASVAFSDGSQSSGSLEVVDYSALIAASAVNSITVTANTAHTNALITLPGFTFRHGIDWRTGATAAATAESIKVALSRVPWLSLDHPAGSSIVYATATIGAFYNTASLISTDADLAVNTATFEGGHDNAVLRINGTPLRQGAEFTASTDNDTTATSLRSAINTAFSSDVTAGGSGANITLVSNLNGSAKNFSLSSSDGVNLTVSGAAMTGGTDAALALSGNAITIPAHGLTKGLAVLYSTSSSLAVIDPLEDQATYYVFPITADTIGLAASKEDAVAGTLITFTSTPTHSSALSYTLAPLGITGNPSFKWQVSNDNSNWFDIAVPTMTMGPGNTPYSASPTNTLWSFGAIGPRYLRLNVLGPTTGGIRLTTVLTGTD